MKFDKNNVFTAVNADLIHPGTTGYFADSLKALQLAVEQEDVFSFNTVTKIQDEHHTYRFSCQRNGSKGDFALFYLVEEPKEKKFRPYKDTDEMVEDYKRRYNSYGGGNGKNNPMYNPLVWVKAEDVKEHKYLITRFSDSGEVTMNFETCVYTTNLRTLFSDYTYLDGSPCGIEE